MRDAFKLAINIESNRKASSQMYKRDEGRLWKETRPHTVKPTKEDDKVDKLANVVKDLSTIFDKGGKSFQDNKPPYQR